MPGLGCGPSQCQALSVRACCCSRGFHPLYNRGRPLPPVPTGPSKADFPRQRSSRGGSQPGTGGRQGRAEDAGEPASEPEEGVEPWPVTEMKIVLPRLSGLGMQTQLENFNLHQQTHTLLSH